MATMQVKDLEGVALDYAVAICEGGVNFRHDTVSCYWITINGKDRVFSTGWSRSQCFAPSTCWGYGGPIIERENISLWPKQGIKSDQWFAERWQCYALGRDTRSQKYGKTPLIAAMRCYVASKLGCTVEIPNIILGGVK